MKQFFSLLLGLGFALTAGAESATYSLTGASPTNMIVLGPLKLNSITVTSTSQTNGLIKFFDSPNLFATNYVAAFTNYTVSTGLYTNTYTDFYGRASTNYYTRKSVTTNTVAGGMRNRAEIAQLTTVSNTVTLLEFDGVFVANGLLATNITQLGGTPGNVSITVNYDKLR